jgi:zinc protease
MMTAAHASHHHGAVRLLTAPDATIETPGRNALRHRNWWRSIPGRALAATALVVTATASGSAQVVDWPAEASPRPLAPKEVSFPPYEVRTLGNGLQVMTVLHHEQPAVTMRLVVRAGAAQDPAGKDGLAYLTAQLLDQGTMTKSASQIADEIDFIGGAMGTSPLPDLTSANVIVMKDSFDPGMRMLSDIVRNPAFAPEEIDRQKKQMLSTLQVSADDPQYVANAVFDRLVYGTHPYGLPGSGTAETIGAITREDLRAFHQRYYVPNNMILAIVGDVTGEEAFSAAERVFGAWPRSRLQFDKPAPPPAAVSHVLVVDKPDAVQTEIRVGQLAIPRKDPDYLAWDLAIKILGGEGANRLHRVLRTERGLTYGASADTEAMKQAGDFVAETDTRTETTGEALELIVREMKKLSDAPVSVRELGLAQAYLSGSFPLTIETPNEIAVQVLNAMFYELPMKEISNFRERVTAITPDDIQRVAQQYIRPDRLTVVLVGNARGFVPQLQSRGLTNFEVIPIADLDLMQPALRRVRTRASAPDRTAPLAGVNVSAIAEPAAHRRTAVSPASRRSKGASHVGIVLASQQEPRRPAPPPPPPAPASPASPPTAVPRPAPPATTQTAPRPSNAATELLRRVIAARGGLEALKGIRSVVADTDTTVMDPNGREAQATRTKTYVLYPDKFRVDIFVQDDQISQVFNAGRAWQDSPGGLAPLPPELQADFAKSVKRDIVPLLIAASEGRYQMQVLQDERGADGRTLHVLQISGADLDPVQLHIDEQMLLVKQSYSTTPPAPPPGRGGRASAPRQVRVEEVFSDYRSVNGIKVPFEASVVQDGRTLMRRVVTRIAFNDPSVTPQLFDPPRELDATPPGRGRGR